MKKIVFTLVTLLLLAACAPAAAPAPTGGLAVVVGESRQTFGADELAALPATQSAFKDVTYQGVTLSALLEAAGADPAAVKAVKAVAADGYSVNYDPAQVLKENVIVAYALADGSAMSADDGTFRMVLPDEEGKLNVRMLVELQAVQ